MNSTEKNIFDASSAQGEKISMPLKRAVFYKNNLAYYEHAVEFPSSGQENKKETILKERDMNAIENRQQENDCELIVNVPKAALKGIKKSLTLQNKNIQVGNMEIVNDDCLQEVKDFTKSRVSNFPLHRLKNNMSQEAILHALRGAEVEIVDIAGDKFRGIIASTSESKLQKTLKDGLALENEVVARVQQILASGYCMQ